VIFYAKISIKNNLIKNKEKYFSCEKIYMVMDIRCYKKYINSFCEFYSYNEKIEMHLKNTSVCKKYRYACKKYQSGYKTSKPP